MDKRARVTEHSKRHSHLSDTNICSHAIAEMPRPVVTSESQPLKSVLAARWRFPHPHLGCSRAVVPEGHQAAFRGRGRRRHATRATGTSTTAPKVRINPARTGGVTWDVNDTFGRVTRVTAKPEPSTPTIVPPRALISGDHATSATAGPG